MKKVFLTFGIITSLILSTSCSTDEANETLENEEIQTDTSYQKADGSVTTVWTIGRKSMNCNRLGICKLSKVKIKVESIEATVYDNKMFAADVKILNANNFTLQIDEENMRDIRKEYGGEYLILEEDYVIEKTESDNLKLSNGFTIKAGQYNLIKNGSNSLFEVQISNQ
jgi:hypothetical protein